MPARHAMRSLAALLLLAAAPATAEPPEPAPIVVGESYAVTEADGTTRQVNVYLPDGYAAGDARYPVLYLIDGGLSQDFLHVAGASALNAMWGRSKAAIVVGIESKQRRAELVGSPGNAEERAAYPEAGHSGQFRAFLRDEVKPLVEARYRTSGEDGVIGESLAGLFIVETWLEAPDLFDGYAAIDPSLWWDDGALARTASSAVRDGKPRGPILLSYANDGPETEDGIGLVAAAAGSGACVLARPDLTHATAYHVLTPQALQFLFPTGETFDAAWGFEVPCSPRS